MLIRSYADVVPTNTHQKTPSSKPNILARQPVAERLSTIENYRTLGKHFGQSGKVTK